MSEPRPDPPQACRVWPLPAGPPLSALAASFGDERHPLLFESGVGADPFGRWNLLMWDPLEVLRGRVEDDGPNAFQRLDAALERHFPGVFSGDCGAMGESGNAGDGLPAFRGGVAGWLSYDLGRQLERLPSQAVRDADVPDLMMGVHAFAVAEDSSTGRRLLVGRGTEEQAVERRADYAMASERAQPAAAPTAPTGPCVSSLQREAYVAAVERVAEHILDGDVYQVNIAQRFEVPWSGRPQDLHARLRRRSPAPFGALLRSPGVAVISDSPELFLRRRGDQVLSRPVKGTRPRGRDVAEDAALQAALEASPKEQAELAMIVDLVRNDLGRSATLGSVRVELPFQTDAWSNVFHRVADVHAQVPRTCRPGDLLAAAFPPASVTGTPKIRAQEVIDSLEPVRRHVYTGALGWIGADGNCDLSVAIRIATAVPGRLLVPVGSGITLLSDAAEEYDETLHKARAMFDALNLPLPPGATRVPSS